MPTFEHDGMEHHYETAGRPETPPVVLLHGFTSDGRMWLPQFRALEPRFFAIALDLRGHGATAAPQELERYSVPLCAGDVAALMDHLQLDLAAVVGCSYGGMVALQFAVDHPERLAALVLTDTSAAYDDPRYDEAFRERERGIDAQAARVAKIGTAGVARREAATAKDDFAAEGIRSRWAGIKTEGFLGTVHARRTRPGLLGQLGDRISVPTLVCHGEDDPVLGASRLMAAELPQARVVTFGATGHGIPARRPEAFNDVLLTFFSDVEEGHAIAGERTVP